MITFKSRNKAIRNADRVTRAVNSIYPHISESKIKKSVEHQQAKRFPDNICYKLGNFKLKKSIELDNLRYKQGEGIDLFRDIINMLKQKKIGNCYESAVIAQIIGKINGINNIYPSKIFFSRNKSRHQMQLDHVVAIITDKPFKPEGYYNFKNNDAIIVDPWLGVTEYVGDYVNKLRTNFANIFPSIPDSRYSFKFLKSIAHNIEEFKEKRKNMFNPDFTFKLHTEELLSVQDAEVLKKDFPELILK